MTLPSTTTIKISKNEYASVRVFGRADAHQIEIECPHCIDGRIEHEPCEDYPRKANGRITCNHCNGECSIITECQHTSLEDGCPDCRLEFEK